MRPRPVRNTAPGADTRRGAAGFTLLELLVVLIIMGVAMAVILPRLGPQLASARLSAAASELSSMASVARFRSVQDERAWELEIRQEPPSLVLFRAGDQTPVLVRELPRLVSVAWTEVQGRPVENGVGVVRFLPDGSATRARMRLASGSPGGLLLEIGGALGTVRAREVGDEG